MIVISRYIVILLYCSQIVLRTFTLTTVALFLLLPLPLLADSVSITRSAALPLIWAPLNRPVQMTNEPRFQDVSEDHPNFALITYAKARGVIDDSFRFFPDESLRINDALVWLLRSRNIKNPDDITYDTIERYAKRYGMIEFGASEENTYLTQENLSSLINTLDTALQNEQHIVSYYADAFAGRNTAFGEKFNPQELTAAHKTLPHNTLVRVKNMDNDREVTVRINDRGPYIAGRDMDLSLAAFERIGELSNGILRNVTFERLGSSEIISACQRVRYQRRLGRTLLTPGIPGSIPIGTTLKLSANHDFRMILMRSPGKRPVRSRDWTRRGDELEITFDREGTYTFVLHEDSGRRRRFRTRVTGECM